MGQNKFLLIIKADTNDACYVTRTKEWTEEDKYAIDIEQLKKVAKALETENGSWGKGDMMDEDNNPNVLYNDVLTDEEVDWFNALTPSSEYGIHTIESIDLYEIKNKTEIY